MVKHIQFKHILIFKITYIFCAWCRWVNFCTCGCFCYLEYILLKAYPQQTIYKYRFLQQQQHHPNIQHKIQSKKKILVNNISH